MGERRQRPTPGAISGRVPPPLQRSREEALHPRHPQPCSGRCTRVAALVEVISPHSCPPQPVISPHLPPPSAPPCSLRSALLASPPCLPCPLTCLLSARERGSLRLSWRVCTTCLLASAPARLPTQFACSWSPSLPRSRRFACSVCSPVERLSLAVTCPLALLAAHRAVQSSTCPRCPPVERQAVQSVERPPSQRPPTPAGL